MDLDVLFWLVIAGIVAAWLLHALPGPAEALSGMFGFREVLWPPGVQEDDDAHWSWARPRRERPAKPEIMETSDPEIDAPTLLDAPEGPIGVVGGRYEVSAAVRAQVRSAPRARS